jgi:1,4-dihydroxy-2-naphthoyl-CoA hydrolase
VFNPQVTVTDLNSLSVNTLAETLGIVVTEVGRDFIKATMPVDHRTQQPQGLLHGGASVALAETLGSMAAFCTIDQNKKACVGLEINANHIRAVRNGKVTGTARPLHIGSSTQVWEIHICNAEDQLISVSRITMAVIDKR